MASLKRRSFLGFLGSLPFVGLAKKLPTPPVSVAEIGTTQIATTAFVTTSIYISPEAMEDIRNWGIDQLDEVSRKEIFP